VATAGALWQLSRQSADLYRAMAVEGAALQAQTLAEVRRAFAPDAARERALPSPEALLRQVGERLERDHPGATVRLYGDPPPGPPDAFQEEALAALRQHPDRPFYRFEHDEGRPVLRYAVAVRAPADGSGAGGIEVLEVVRPLDDSVAQAHAGLRWTLLGTVAA